MTATDGMDMQYESIAWLRKHSAAWRLLCSDNAALTLSFLGRVFVDENVREITESDLVGRLDDALHTIHQRLGETLYPKPPRAYLLDWADPDKGWLRRYYPHGSDEPHYDVTPDVELAVSWVRGLGPRDFVGTESRLSTIIELLRQMVYGSETDPSARRRELERRREEIDEQLAALERGEVPLLDAVSQQDRFQQFDRMSRELLADFRQVEENFRRLDRQLRGRIASWEGSKAELLDEVLGSRSSIAGSPQGRSFEAFFDLLLSESRQGELSELLERMVSIDGLNIADRSIRYVHHDWQLAGDRTQATVRKLSEQLRRFLDDQAWLENRRVMDLIGNIQNRALELKDCDTRGFWTELDAAAPAVVLPTERPLYEPQGRLELDSVVIDSDVDDAELDDAALFDQSYVDARELSQSVRATLRHTGQADLSRVVAENPLSRGVAELVTYMSLRDEAFDTVFDDAVRETYAIVTTGGEPRTVRLPRVTFVRKHPEHAS